jgi:hypothetical protein
MKDVILNDRAVVNCEFERMWKKSAVSHLKHILEFVQTTDKTIHNLSYDG